MLPATCFVISRQQSQPVAFSRSCFFNKVRSQIALDLVCFTQPISFLILPLPPYTHPDYIVALYRQVKSSAVHNLFGCRIVPKCRFVPRRGSNSWKRRAKWSQLHPQVTTFAKESWRKSPARGTKRDRLRGRPGRRWMKTETAGRRLKCRWKTSHDRDRPPWPNATCRWSATRAESHANVPLVLGIDATAPSPKPWRKLSWILSLLFFVSFLIVCCSRLIMILTVLPGG